MLPLLPDIVFTQLPTKDNVTSFFQNRQVLGKKEKFEQYLIDIISLNRIGSLQKLSDMEEVATDVQFVETDLEEFRFSFTFQSPEICVNLNDMSSLLSLMKLTHYYKLNDFSKVEQCAQKVVFPVLQNQIKFISDLVKVQILLEQLELHQFGRRDSTSDGDIILIQFQRLECYCELLEQVKELKIIPGFEKFKNYFLELTLQVETTIQQLCMASFSQFPKMSKLLQVQFQPDNAMLQFSGQIMDHPSEKRLSLKLDNSSFKITSLLSSKVACKQIVVVGEKYFKELEQLYVQYEKNAMQIYLRNAQEINKLHNSSRLPFIEGRIKDLLLELAQPIVLEQISEVQLLLQTATAKLEAIESKEKGLSAEECSFYREAHLLYLQLDEQLSQLVFELDQIKLLEPQTVLVMLQGQIVLYKLGLEKFLVEPCERKIFIENQLHMSRDFQLLEQIPSQELKIAAKEIQRFNKKLMSISVNAQVADQIKFLRSDTVSFCNNLDSQIEHYHRLFYKNVIKPK